MNCNDKSAYSLLWRRSWVFHLHGLCWVCFLTLFRSILYYIWYSLFYSAILTGYCYSFSPLSNPFTYFCVHASTAFFRKEMLCVIVCWWGIAIKSVCLSVYPYLSLELIIEKSKYVLPLFSLVDLFLLWYHLWQCHISLSVLKIIYLSN